MKSGPGKSPDLEVGNDSSESSELDAKTSPPVNTPDEKSVETQKNEAETKSQELKLVIKELDSLRKEVENSQSMMLVAMTQNQLNQPKANTYTPFIPPFISSASPQSQPAPQAQYSQPQSQPQPQPQAQPQNQPTEEKNPRNKPLITDKINSPLLKIIALTVMKKITPKDSPKRDQINESLKQADREFKSDIENKKMAVEKMKDAASQKLEGAKGTAKSMKESMGEKKDKIIETVKDAGSEITKRFR